jgi:hypothetical protein
MLAKFEIHDLSEQEVQISSLSNFLDALLKGRNNGSQMLTVPLSIPTLENPSRARALPITGAFDCAMT